MAGACSAAPSPLAVRHSDTCLEVLAELRYDIPIEAKGLRQAQLYGFVDHGWLHNIAPVLGTFKTVDAASLGAGLRLGWLNADYR